MDFLALPVVETHLITKLLDITVSARLEVGIDGLLYVFKARRPWSDKLRNTVCVPVQHRDQRGDWQRGRYQREVVRALGTLLRASPDSLSAQSGSPYEMFSPNYKAKNEPLNSAVADPMEPKPHIHYFLYVERRRS